MLPPGATSLPLADNRNQEFESNLAKLKHLQTFWLHLDHDTEYRRAAGAIKALSVIANRELRTLRVPLLYLVNQTVSKSEFHVPCPTEILPRSLQRIILIADTKNLIRWTNLSHTSAGPRYKSRTILVELLQSFVTKRYTDFTELKEIVYLFGTDEMQEEECACNTTALREHYLASEEFLGSETVEIGDDANGADEDVHPPPTLCPYHKLWDAVKPFALVDGTATTLKKLCRKLEEMGVEVKLESRSPRWLFKDMERTCSK